MKTLTAAPIDHTFRRSPLPDPVRSPLWLLAAIAPQAILLVLNLLDYRLMAGEMTEAQRHLGWGIFAGQIALGVGSALCALWWKWRQRPIPWLAYLAVFLAHAGWLAVVTTAVGENRVIPNSVSLWIVPAGQFIFHQWVFVMPGLFLPLLALANFPTACSRAFDLGRSSLVAVLVPVSWYVGMVALSGTRPPAFVIVTFMVGSSLLCLGAFLRAVTILFVWADRGTAASRMVLAVVFGLLAPLAGLALNASIPFPADFQSAPIYALAVVNGLVLMLPVTNRAWVDRAVWLARCALLPFTVYFFLVFLPFLPLAIPAMVAFGAGFLILVPTALMVVHGRLVVEPLIMDVRDGLGFRSLGLALAAAALLPGGVAAAAWFDREALRAAMDYVFSPDHTGEPRFAGNRLFVRRALESVRDQKASAYRPFLSEFYDAVVFDGLTLATPKMQTLHRAFFGQPLGLPQKSSTIEFRNRRRMTGAPARNTVPFPRDVRVTDLRTTSREENGCTVTSVVLDLKNQSAAQSEYVTTITVPPGAMVSGYWLHVGPERVPGRIFEKKSATWVYQMIRDVTRRDPGLLTYQSPTTLELRVFPFGEYERRSTEIEFLTPPGWTGSVQIGDRSVAVNSPSAGFAWTRRAGGARLVVPPAAGAALPEVRRTPFLHFIVDRSAGSQMDPRRAVSAMREVLAKFPDVRWVRVTAANYERRTLTAGLWPVENLDALASIPETEWLPARGGFLRDHAVKSVLVQNASAWARVSSSEPLFGLTPAVVVLRGTSTETVADDALAPFADLVPDGDGFWERSVGGVVEMCSWSGQRRPFAPFVPAGLHVFRCGDRLAACRLAADQPAMADFVGASLSDHWEVFDPAAGVFSPGPDSLPVPPSSRYARAVDAWQLDAAHRQAPGRAPHGLRDIVRASRDSGILVPSTSYIVVENSAQWRALERKEAQRLNGRQNLDLMESPEPSTVLVALATAAFLLRRRRRKIHPAA